MNYLEALRLVHDVVKPSNYCEIGCRLGVSLALSRSRSVAIDPDFDIQTELTSPTRLFKKTSDDFFATEKLGDIFGGPIDFAFIDGFHSVEFALRDFMNLESASHASGIIAIDDILPSDLAYATRERQTQIWTGDVYRLIPILRSYRPDLNIRVYDIDMKGLAVITGLNPSSTLLRDSYASIAEELSAGQWAYPSIQEMRAALAPRAVEELEVDLKAFARGRLSTPGAEPGAVRAYLDLLKRSILNEVYLDDEMRILYLKDCLNGADRFDPAALHDIRLHRAGEYEKLGASRSVGQFYERNIHNSGFSHSMMGRKRLDSLHECLDRVRRDKIPGDLIECGVWRGGGCIFMAGYLQAYELKDVRVFVADSFEGVPPPSAPQDGGLDLSKTVFPELAVSIDTVRENFRSYGLDLPYVHYLPGWFKDSLPAAPIKRIALLRMDGDLYESTMDILHNLYDNVVPGGVVIVDDYGAIESCRLAVSDFFASRQLPIPELHEIDWTGVWFVK